MSRRFLSHPPHPKIAEIQITTPVVGAPPTHHSPTPTQEPRHITNCHPSGKHSPPIHLRRFAERRFYCTNVAAPHRGDYRATEVATHRSRITSRRNTPLTQASHRNTLRGSPRSSAPSAKINTRPRNKPSGALRPHAQGATQKQQVQPSIREAPNTESSNEIIPASHRQDQPSRRSTPSTESSSAASTAAHSQDQPSSSQALRKYAGTHRFGTTEFDHTESAPGRHKSTRYVLPQFHYYQITAPIHKC